MLVKRAGAAVQAAAAAGLPCVAGFVAAFGAPVAIVFDPPPQAPSSAAATQAESSAPVERKVEATSDRIGFPLRVR